MNHLTLSTDAPTLEALRTLLSHLGNFHRMTREDRASRCHSRHVRRTITGRKFRQTFPLPRKGHTARSEEVGRGTRRVPPRPNLRPLHHDQLLHHLQVLTHFRQWNHPRAASCDDTLRRIFGFTTIGVDSRHHLSPLDLHLATCHLRRAISAHLMTAFVNRYHSTPSRQRTIRSRTRDLPVHHPLSNLTSPMERLSSS